MTHLPYQVRFTPVAGSTGYLALYEIESRTCVQVLAVRHQLEQDYHWVFWHRARLGNRAQSTISTP